MSDDSNDAPTDAPTGAPTDAPTGAPTGAARLVRPSCAAVRTGVSARLDGEDGAMGVGAIDEHLTGCADCRAYVLEVGRLHRSVRLRTAEDVPDLAPLVLAALPTRGYRVFARYALLAVSITLLLLAVPALLLGHDADAPVHVARHLGSFDIAIGVGLFVAAWRPERARGVLPIAAALAGSMFVTAAVDAARGAVPLLNEAHHLLELAGLLLVWALAGFPTPRVTRRSLRFLA